MLDELATGARDAATAPPAALAAELAGRYAIERELGRGGMATVYLARDLRHERPVALKVLKPELSAALGAERFLREIRITAALVHPHVLPLLDSGEARPGRAEGPALLYYVMPYVDGESLRERLERERQLDVDEAVRIARELADALDCAHRHGVVHRDVKPENVLLEEGHAVMADFGIARAVASSAGERLTETGVAVGSPAYMSPEQALGERAVDGRADVYALGCVLYEMLAGQPPFTGATSEVVIRQHVAVPAPPLAAMRAGVPPQVAAAVARALAKAPADRFRTAAELGAALRAALVPERGQHPLKRPLDLSGPTARRALALAALPLLFVSGTRATVARPPHAAAATAVAARLSSTRVAVFPFVVHAGPESRYLGEAAMDLLSGAIDGVGELRRVDPRALMSQLRREGGPGVAEVDPERARRVSGRFGAGRHVLGTATALGGRVHLAASLYDQSRGDEPVATASREGPAENLSAVVTDLARALFAAQPVGTGGRLTSIAAVQASNHPAEQAYLEGEAFLRRGDYGSAVDALRRAVEADETFALAWYRLAWAEGYFGQDARGSIGRALRHVGRLSERDRLLVTGYHAFIHGDAKQAERQVLAAAGAYPDLVEAWLLIGLIRWWQSWQRGGLNGDAREPLERALALDPDNRDALHGLNVVATRERRYLESDALSARAYPRGGTFDTESRLVSFQATSAFGRGDRESQHQALARLANAPDYAVWQSAEFVAAFTDDLTGASHIAGLLTDPSKRAPETQSHSHFVLALLELAGGRRRAAATEFTRAGAGDPALALTYRAWFAALPALKVPETELRRLRDSLVRWAPRAEEARPGPSSQYMPEELYPYFRTYLLGLLSARLGETDAALRYAAVLERTRAPAHSARLLPDLALEIRALVLTQVGDTAAALATLERANMAIIWSDQVWSALHRRLFGRFLRADLLFAMRRDEEALGWYDGLIDFFRPGFVLVAPAQLRQAEIYERRGDRARAAEYYARFVARWKDCDPELRPLVAEARQRLDRLRSEGASAPVASLRR